METIKCFNKETLSEANDIAVRRKYNRQLVDKFVNSLPEDTWFPIMFTMIHEHARGNKVDPHMRCWIAFNGKGDRAFIDCDIDLYNSLPVFEIPEKKDVENYA